jgi:pectate lyase
MRPFVTVVLVAVSVVLQALASAESNGVGMRAGHDLGRETLLPNDGWASFSTGTTGGATAAPEHVFTVTTRSELAAALAVGPVPKIIYVSGTIDANVDGNNQPLTCADYAVPGYSLEAYLAAYDPATWGRRAPSGTLETLRRASQQAQQARVRINITANTTLVGLGDDARIVGAHVRVSNADNVIIRNLTFEDAYDCFPVWDPLDGSAGNWNSAYDNISLTGATHVWIDHCEFNDGAHPDRDLPVYFGRRFQVHDGAVDITNASDLVTVSWSRFVEHDKVMLIGSSDSAAADRGKLRVTLHHNVFERTVQRGPRVRFGQVHVYNNLYIADAETFSYAFGVGIESQIFAEANVFNTIGEVDASRFISRFNGTSLHSTETLMNGHARADYVDVVAEYNAVREPDLDSTVAWSPVLVGRLDPVHAVEALVGTHAGPLKAGQ